MMIYVCYLSGCYAECGLGVDRMGEPFGVDGGRDTKTVLADKTKTVMDSTDALAYEK